jgi:hypothetical protein
LLTSRKKIFPSFPFKGKALLPILIKSSDGSSLPVYANLPGNEISGRLQLRELFQYKNQPGYSQKDT